MFMNTLYDMSCQGDTQDKQEDNRCREWNGKRYYHDRTTPTHRDLDLCKLLNWLKEDWAGQLWLQDLGILAWLHWLNPSIIMNTTKRSPLGEERLRKAKKAGVGQLGE